MSALTFARSLADLLDPQPICPAHPVDLAVWATSHAEQPRFLDAPHLRLIGDLFVRIGAGEPVRALIDMPPQHGKTSVCRWGVLGYLAAHPNHRVVYGSYAAEFAETHGRWVRRTVEASADPLDGSMPDLGLRLARDSQAAARWETTASGGMLTVGRGGPLTGNTAHLLIVDDPFKNAEEADSRLIRDRVHEWFTTAAMTRLRPDASALVIHTRWDGDDLIGRLSQDGGWELLHLPALAEGDDLLGRKTGEALWPAVYNEAFLAGQRQTLGARQFGALYQGHPTPLEGVLFHRQAIDGSRVTPAGLPPMLTVREYVDPSFSDSPDADETGRVVMGIGEDHLIYVLADLSERAPYDRLPIGDSQHAHGTVGVRVEQNLLGTRVITTIARMLPPDVGVAGIVAKGTKAQRAEAVAALVDNGVIRFAGHFDHLERQLLTWKPTDRDSPDRMDAFVHGARDLEEMGVGPRFVFDTAPGPLLPRDIGGVRRPRRTGPLDAGRASRRPRADPAAADHPVPGTRGYVRGRTGPARHR